MVMDDKTFQKVIFHKIRNLKSIDGVTLADTGRIIETIFESIWSECAAKGNIRIAGIGKFVPMTRKERNGINPSTGEIMRHKESYTIKFLMFDKAKERFRDDFTNESYENTNVIPEGEDSSDE
jgi:bacterial DNA-binding protein